MLTGCEGERKKKLRETGKKEKGHTCASADVSG